MKAKKILLNEFNDGSLIIQLDNKIIHTTQAEHVQEAIDDYKMQCQCDSCNHPSNKIGFHNMTYFDLVSHFPEYEDKVCGVDPERKRVYLNLQQARRGLVEHYFRKISMDIINVNETRDKQKILSGISKREHITI